MSSDNLMQAYISRMGARLERRTQWRAAALIAAALMLIPLIATLIGSQLGFPADIRITGRIVLAISLVLVLVFVWYKPTQRFRAESARAVDVAVPSLGGRAETFSRLDDQHPFRVLLAEESAERLRENAPQKVVPDRDFYKPAAFGLTCIGVLSYFLSAGPTSINFGMRDFYAGWAVDGLTPPTRIVVRPGNDVVRRGAAVRFIAQPEGFTPLDAELHVRLGDAKWQRLPMTALADTTFDTTLYALNERAEYYVSANGVRSETFSVDVLEMPAIQSISVTYNFPEWTGLEARAVDPASDLRAPPGTEIELVVKTEAPLTQPQFVLDGDPVAMTVNAATATVHFEVEGDGQYYIGSMPGKNVVRLSDDYFISEIDDRKPRVEFQRPGRDWKASSIEEVTTEIRVTDDYQVQSLELNYSVNGGEWRAVEFAAGAAEVSEKHVFYLESTGDAEGEQLIPGDLVAYYAQASDYSSEVQTDIFFIEIQPFDRRYTQSQQSGGQPGAGGLGDEISARQREIIVSTWNLIRQQSNANDDGIVDNASLLAELQNTLREQARTLADRARARQLADNDDISRFVSHLEAAAESMEPAARELSAVRFTEALQPEQSALQHLLRAEAVFRDITVSMQNSDGSGGGQDSRDLSEMFELEMDLEKNQYETGSVASNETPEETLDELAEKLRELARRQEQLHKQLAQESGGSERERWEQERLRRETEELQRELQQLSRNRQEAADGSSAGGGTSEQANSDGAESYNENPSTAERRRDELERRVESALRAMRESAEALGDEHQSESAARAAAEASRALEGATNTAEAARSEALAEALETLDREAGDLAQRQQRIEDRIREAVAEELAGLSDGLSTTEASEIAQQKRHIHTDLEDIEQRTKDIGDALTGADPATTEGLQRALDRLAEQRIKERIALSALYVEQGEARYIASSENMITESVDDLSDAIARTAARGTDLEAGAERATLDDALDATQALRATLQENVPEGGESESSAEVGRQTQALASTLERALSDDRDQLNFDQASELRSLRRALLARDAERNDQLLGDEAARALELAEQLELALRQAQAERSLAINGAPPEEVPALYQEAVWNYYRRLAEDGAN